MQFNYRGSIIVPNGDDDANTDLKLALDILNAMWSSSQGGRILKLHIFHANIKSVVLCKTSMNRC